MASEQKDLVILAADKQMEYALRGILGRDQSLGIRQLQVEYIPHPNKDPGCRSVAEKFLRPFHQDFAHALVIFDHHGAGRPDSAADELEKEVEDRLRKSGWEDRAQCIVIEPELEVWVWSDSPQVKRCLEWDREIRLREWLQERGRWEPGKEKPGQPKEALERVLRETGLPRSSALFRKLAERMSLQRCNDRAFVKLRRILREWFSKKK